MGETSFYMLCEELRPYLTKQTTKLRKPVSVETQVASVISEKLGPKYIALPKTKEEVEEHGRNFYNRYGFPQCTGAVDRTHIKIKRPVDNPTDYASSKFYISLSRNS